jgi:hypothetical protein
MPTQQHYSTQRIVQVVTDIETTRCIEEKSKESCVGLDMLLSWLSIWALLQLAAAVPNIHLVGNLTDLQTTSKLAHAAQPFLFVLSCISNQ